MATSQSAPVTMRSASDVCGRLREVLGARLTAVIAGVRDTRTVDRWVDGTETPTQPIEARLRAALEVTETLLPVDSPEVIRLWFMGQNPILDDDAPALHLATEPDEVLQAARVFAFHG
jgi:hypothetical protein